MNFPGNKGARWPTGNRKFTKVPHEDGHVFDSKVEAARYEELKLLQKAGMIRNLKVHTKHRLELNGNHLLIRSKGYPNGRKSTWTDDFNYEERITVDGEVRWQIIYEDVKGRDTYPERFKRGVFELLTGHQIRVVY